MGKRLFKKSQKKDSDNTVLSMVGEVNNSRESDKSLTDFPKVDKKFNTSIFFLFLNIKSHSRAPVSTGTRRRISSALWEDIYSTEYNSFMKIEQFSWKPVGMIMRIILKLKLAAKQHSEILLRRLFLHSSPWNWAEKERKISLAYEEQTYISDSAINIKPCILKCSRIC